MYVHQLPGSGGSLWAVWVWGEGQIGASCVVRDLARRTEGQTAAAAANVFHMSIPHVFLWFVCLLLRQRPTARQRQRRAHYQNFLFLLAVLLF